MTKLPKEFGEIVQSMISAVTDEALSQWQDWVDQIAIPDIIRTMLPAGVECLLVNRGREAKDAALHQQSIDEIFGDDSLKELVAGTLDASEDPRFRQLYLEHGWRTAVYFPLQVIHQGLKPGQTSQRQRAVVMVQPVILVSKQPYALDLQSFRTACFAITVLTSAMVLRFGMTWYATRSSRMLDNIAGVIFILSATKIFECNDKCREWFDLPDSRQFPLLLTETLPNDIYNWIRSALADTDQVSEKHEPEFFWLTTRDQIKRRVEAKLAPFKPFEFLDMRAHMTTGFDGITGDAADRSIFILTMRDISAQWKAQELEHEMNMARRVQVRLQPAPPPWSAVFDVAGACLPANHVGGDLYDLVRLEDDRLAVIVADAAGHGLHSALLAAVVTGAFRSVVNRDPEVQVVLRSIDAALRTISQTGFVTAAYLLFEADGRKVSYGLAGHHCPIRYGLNGIQSLPESPSSLPLGVGLPARYFTSSYELQRGDTIMIFSDGLVDSQNSQGSHFESQLPGLFDELQGRQSDQMLDSILGAVTKFRGDCAQEDDITAVIVKLR